MQTPDEETSQHSSRAEPENGREASEVAEAPRTPLNGTAAYIADMTKELSELARGSGLDTLAYLLDIAQLEAATETRRTRRRQTSTA